MLLRASDSALSVPVIILLPEHKNPCASVPSLFAYSWTQSQLQWSMNVVDVEGGKCSGITLLFQSSSAVLDLI